MYMLVFLYGASKLHQLSEPIVLSDDLYSLLKSSLIIGQFSRLCTPQLSTNFVMNCCEGSLRIEIL